MERHIKALFDRLWEKRKQELQKQIDTLKAKIRKEKQMNKQMEINAELKHLQAEFSALE